jgi:hypothetical protein
MVEWLFDEHRRAGTPNSSGARDNIRIANAALVRLVRSGDRGVLTALERELPAARPGSADLLRAMAVATPPPDQFARTLVVLTDAPNTETVATAYELMAKLDTPADLDIWVPAAARALADARRQPLAARAMYTVAGKTALGMPELARLAESSAPNAVRVGRTRCTRQCKRRDARAASDRARRRQASGVASVSGSARKRTCWPVFDEAARAFASPSAISAARRRCIWKR